MDGWRLVDLTQPLGPATPSWPGATAMHVTAIAEIADAGLYERDIRLPEHVGTHLDAPAHFDAGGARTHQLALDELFVPVRVVDARQEVGDDPDAAIGVVALAAHEAVHGEVRPGDAVIFRTGWERHLGDPARYVSGPEGPPRFPGLTVAVAQHVVDRGAVGIGIDTLGVDPGHDTGYPVHRLTLPAGLWHLEGLVRLSELPARGAWLIVGLLPLVDGSGAPARVMALVPAAARPEGDQGRE